MPEAGKGAEGAEQEPVTEPVVEDKKIEIDGEEYDPDRALKTIKAQRESEQALKEKLRKYEEAEQAAAEAEKSLEVKLADRDAEVSELRKGLALRDAADTFLAQAEDAGIADPRLALLVAKENGLFSTYDPKTGEIEVGKVDFDKLVEDHPVLQGEAPGRKPTGDAGRRTGGKTLTPGEIFNRSVRGMDD